MNSNTCEAGEERRGQSKVDVAYSAVDGKGQRVPRVAIAEFQNIAKFVRG